MHSSYFGCFSEPSIEVSLSLHGGCVAAIPSTRSGSLSVRFACQYLTSVHKIHSCKKQDSESPPCFLWKVIRLSLWPRIWEVANHWHEELLLHGSATWRALNFRYLQSKERYLTVIMKLSMTLLIFPATVPLTTSSHTRQYANPHHPVIVEIGIIDLG